MLGLSRRTLSRWKRRPLPLRRGRPPHGSEVLNRSKKRVQFVLKRLGFGTGRKTIHFCLPNLSWRLINYSLKELKAELRRQTRARASKQRKSLRYLTRNTVMAQDSTHVVNFRGKRVWAEAQKDLATLEARAFGNGEPTTVRTVVANLKKLKLKDRLPLVFSTDNGPAYRSALVQTWLKEHFVIQLLSRPRTPTDNGSVERAIGEGKALLGQDPIRRSSDGPRRLNQAFRALNRKWPRSSRYGLTASELRKKLPHWRSRVSRSRFFYSTSKAIKRKTYGLRGRAFQKARREAIFATLLRFKLASFLPLKPGPACRHLKRCAI